MSEMFPSDQVRGADKPKVLADTQRGQGIAWEQNSPLGSLAVEFATLTSLLVEADTVGGVLQQLVEAARQFVPDATLVSVTLQARDGSFHTPVQTDQLAIELDEIQYKLNEGPCLTAADEAGPALARSDDLAHDTQWPGFAPAAAERGLGAVLSTALVAPARSRHLAGALNIYSSYPAGLNETDQAVALLLATHASLALAHTDAVTQAQLESEQLRGAIDTRDVIGQAKGILMARRGMSAEEAFELLRRTSQQMNIKLIRLAETLATRHREMDLPG